eukprot:gene4122-57_t
MSAIMVLVEVVNVFKLNGYKALSITQMNTRKVPLSKLKKLLQGKDSRMRVEKHVETLVYLECIIYLRELAKQAAQEAQRSHTKVIQNAHITKAAQVLERKLSVE